MAKKPPLERFDLDREQLSAVRAYLERGARTVETANGWANGHFWQRFPQLKTAIDALPLKAPLGRLSSAELNTIKAAFRACRISIDEVVR